MKANELIKELEQVDEDSEVILVVYTEDKYEAGYVDRIDTHTKFNSVTGDRLKDDEKVVEITTTTKAVKR